jgi:PAS domain S-box-containing protein
MDIGECLLRALDDSPIGTAIGRLDGHWFRVNRAFAEILGYRPAELVGRSFADFTHPDDVADDYEAQRQLAAGVIGSHQRVKRYVRRDGSIAYTRLIASVLRDPGGEPVCYFAQVWDLTESVRAEREREESLRWLQAVLEQSPVGLLLVHGPDARRVQANSRLQEMIGGPIETVDRLRGLFTTLDGEPIDQDSCPSVSALRGEWPPDVEMLLHDVRGGVTPVVGSFAPIVDAAGHVLGIVVAVQDVSAARELERLRAEWSSVVAHDLRQPLGAVLLHAKLLGHLAADPRVHLHVDRIGSAVMRLNRMVDDIMDLSRLDARRLELVRRSVDLPALVRASVERMALEAPDRPFDVKVDGVIPRVEVDPDRVAQVMENLLTNAVKYGTGGTPIVVAVECLRGDVAVAVTNDGKPLGPDELESLFQRFQRAPSAKLRGIRGTGLGLYITRSLVEAHGGRIVADSSPRGRITFRFTLPATGS